MGQLYTFECRSCGYRAEVSGGDDAGMVGVTTTILCEACQELYDVVIWRKSEPEAERKNPHCPKSKKHLVRTWEYPGPCPRCGEPLDVDANGPIILWD